MAEREREINKALAEMEYWVKVIYTELLDKKEYEKADRIITAHSTVEYIISNHLKGE